MDQTLAAIQQKLALITQSFLETNTSGRKTFHDILVMSMRAHPTNDDSVDVAHDAPAIYEITMNYTYKTVSPQSKSVPYQCRIHDTVLCTEAHPDGETWRHIKLYTNGKIFDQASDALTQLSSYYFGKGWNKWPLEHVQVFSGILQHFPAHNRYQIWWNDDIPRIDIKLLSDDLAVLPHAFLSLRSAFPNYDWDNPNEYHTQ